MRWAVCIADWRSHAIEDTAEPPAGYYRAVCGRLLTLLVVLVDQPQGPACEDCAITQVARRPSHAGRRSTGRRHATGPDGR